MVTGVKMPAEGGIPGLVDVILDDGRVFTDITMGQLWQMEVRDGWRLLPQARP